MLTPQYASHVTCQVSGVRCQVSQFSFGPSSQASRWRVCYHLLWPYHSEKIYGTFSHQGHWSLNLQFWLRNGLKSPHGKEVDCFWSLQTVLLYNMLMWHVTGDMQHVSVTCDIWKITCVKWRMTADTLHFFFWILLYWCYYPHTLRDSVSAVCGIFLFIKRRLNYQPNYHTLFRTALDWKSHLAIGKT